MKHLFVFLMLCNLPSAFAAMEVTRSLTAGSSTLDPMAPTLLYWHAHPSSIVTQPPIMMFSHAQPYHLDELASQSAGIVFHQNPMAFAVAMTTLGQAHTYRESDISITLGRRVRPWLSAGAGIHWVQLQFGPRFSSTQFILGDMGLIARLNNLQIGVSLTDVGSPAVGGRITSPSRYRAALSYRYSPRLVLRTGTEFYGRWQYSIGETLLIHRNLHVRVDLITPPARVQAGVRLTIGKLQVDFIIRDHPDLGGDQLLVLGWQL
jgi:hypothetical protein